jgi:hypothetical protein
MNRSMPSFNKRAIVSQLAQSPNWVTDPDPDTRKGCGPCQVGTVVYEKPPHFWGARPTLPELEYAQRKRMGALGGNGNQTGWCVASNQFCGKGYQQQ